MQDAAAARERQLLEVEAMSIHCFKTNPHPPIILGCTLPPPPGLLQFHANRGLQQIENCWSGTHSLADGAAGSGKAEVAHTRNDLNDPNYIKSSISRNLQPLRFHGTTTKQQQDGSQGRTNFNMALGTPAAKDVFTVSTMQNAQGV